MACANGEGQRDEPDDDERGQDAAEARALLAPLVQTVSPEDEGEDER